MSSYETWVNLICGTEPDVTAPFFSSSPVDGCIDLTSDMCHTCVDGTITGYRYRVNGGTWTLV